MTPLTKEQFIPRTRATATAYTPLRRTAIVAGLLLTMMPLLAGCGGEETGSTPTAAAPGATLFFAWDPVRDRSVNSYFVHYGRHSPDEPGSCTYERSLYTESPSATVTNLNPGTRYYFAVSAYSNNDVASPCSDEISILTPASAPG